MSLSKCQISPLNCTFMTRELDDQVDHRFAWGNANLAAVALTTCASFVASSNWAGLSTKRRCLRHCRRRAAMVAVSENTQQPTRETPDLPTYPYRPTNLLTNIQTTIQRQKKVQFLYDSSWPTCLRLRALREGEKVITTIALLSVSPKTEQFVNKVAVCLVI